MDKSNNAQYLNLERWRFYLKDRTSPDIFIDMAFYSMIAAALQRRVYWGSDERPLFCNLYTILTAEPGVGKGVVIEVVDDILRYHKLRRTIQKKPEEMDLKEQMEIAEAALNDFRAANGLDEVEPTKKPSAKIQEDPLVIPIAAQSTGYEALVYHHAKALRSIIVKDQPNNKLLRNGIYTHCSLAFVLEEISSLFRKHTEDVVNYLLVAYDCKKDYERKTLLRGSDLVRRPCLNFLGGTTPGFMKATFKDNLLNEGFASRALFAFAEKNRFERFDQSSFSEEQMEAKQAIIDHIGKLTTLFGLATFNKEDGAYEFMRSYIEETIPKERILCPPKLIYYHSRKNIHLRKLAMVMHFSECHDSMIVSLDSCKRAVTLLTTLEVNMEQALQVGGRSPIGTIAGKLLKYLDRGPSAFNQIWGELVEEGNKEEITEALLMLQNTGKVGKIDSANKDSKYYRIRG